MAACLVQNQCITLGITKYYHTVSMTFFDRAVYIYIGFAQNLPMENAISQTLGCFPSIVTDGGGIIKKKKLQNMQFQ